MVQKEEKTPGFLFILTVKQKGSTMKQITLLTATAFLAILLISGCSSIQRRTVAVANSTNYSVNVVSPLIEPKVEVKEKITGKTPYLRYLFCCIPLQSWTQVSGTPFSWWMFSPFDRLARAAATEDAFKRSKADVLIDPTYTVKWWCYILWSTYKAEVHGYVGKYTSFKQITLKDQKELGLLDNNCNIEILPGKK